MFRCYQFNPTENEIEILKSYSKHERYNRNSDYVKTKLRELLISHENIDVGKLQNDWFPSINSRIFISHSHNDEKLAIEFANYIEEKIGETSFIDSCVWNNVKDLLKELDNEYCLNENKETYDYDKRNITTSHSYMILNAALEKQIDKCDCIIFLNTENSILKESNANLQVTNSPWIYSELTFTKYARINPPKNYKPIKESKSELKHSQNIKMDYNVDLTNFKKINLEIIDRVSNLSKMSGDVMEMLYCCIK